MKGSILIGNIDKPVVRGVIFVKGVRVDTPEELRVALKVLGKTSGWKPIINQKEERQCF
jgi:hypothetical protein